MGRCKLCIGLFDAHCGHANGYLQILWRNRTLANYRKTPNDEHQLSPIEWFASSCDFVCMHISLYSTENCFVVIRYIRGHCMFAAFQQCHRFQCFCCCCCHLLVARSDVCAKKDVLCCRAIIDQACLLPAIRNYSTMAMHLSLSNCRRTADRLIIIQCSSAIVSTITRPTCELCCARLIVQLALFTNQLKIIHCANWIICSWYHTLTTIASGFAWSTIDY